MNKLLNGLRDWANYDFTENGGAKHLTTTSALLDMFSLGGAFRNRTEDDCKLLFRQAYAENPEYALKCLFYLRDVRSGQGERRFFRVVMNDLATYDTAAARRNMQYIAEFGRWDDLYCFVDTPLEDEMFSFLKDQLALDTISTTPSLLAKWLKSENTSSEDSRNLASRTRRAFGMSHKQYRKTLSILRERINVLERLISAGKWNEVEFDKIPSKAGLKYKNAFARHDFERYMEFAKSEKKVNASVLNPVDIAHQIFTTWDASKTDRLMWQKYWDNQKDYYNGKEENAIAVVDVSGSMSGTPMEAAVSMGAYIAERGHGPFANHFITFSQNPQLVEFKGVDIYDKFSRARKANWGYDTNIEKVFDLLLAEALRTKCKAEDLVDRIYILSDMEFNDGLKIDIEDSDTLFESIKKKWARYGYTLPNVIFWNLDARNDNIPAIGEGFSYVSGNSMSVIEAILSGKTGYDFILSGKTGYDLMMTKLDSERYSVIH